MIKIILKAFFIKFLHLVATLFLSLFGPKNNIGSKFAKLANEQDHKNIYLYWSIKNN